MTKTKDILKSVLYHSEFKLFLIIWMMLNGVFLYYQMTFFWGNHDWDWVKGTTQILQVNTGLFEGRYAKFLLNVGLFGGQILPILNNMTAFALLAFGMVGLMHYWRIEDFFSKILISLCIVLSPYILGWMYFPINILGNFMAVALVAWGLCLSERKSTRIGAIICFLVALGVYPSVAEMSVVCYMVGAIIRPDEPIKESIKSFGILVLSLVLFKGLLWILGYYHLIYQDYYNLKTISLIEMISRVPQALIYAVQQLSLTLPFFPMTLRIIGGLCIIFAIIGSYRTASHKMWNVIMWSGALFATVMSYLLTAMPEEVLFMPRVNFYGVNFLYGGSIAILLGLSVGRKNLAYILSIMMIMVSINEICYAQKVWHFGKTAEQNLVTRIADTLSEHKPIVRTPIIAGELSLRPKYYNETYDKESPYTLNRSFLVRHIPAGMYNFYEPYQIFKGESRINMLTSELHTFIARNQSMWPSDEAVFVDDNYVVILLTAEGRKMIQAQLPN